MRLGWTLAALAGALASSVAATEPDPSLIAAAGRACQEKFEAPEQPMLLEGPGIVLLAGEEDSQWRHKAFVGGTASNEPKTIFCVRSRHEKDGTYSDGSLGYAEHWTVTALSWPDGIVRRKGLLVAPAPAKKLSTPYREDQFGNVQPAGLEKWFAVEGSPALLGNFVGSVYLSPDRRTLAQVVVGAPKKNATSLVDWPSQAPRRRIANNGPAGFLADGRLVIAEKKGLRLWDPASGKPGGLIPGPGNGPVLTRDGTRVMTGDHGDHLHEVPSGRLVNDIPIAVWQYTSAMSTDGHRICGVENDKVVLWSAVEGKTAATFEVGIRDLPSSRCAVAGDGESAAADTREGLYLLNAKDGSTLRLGDSLRASCLAMSRDGRWLAAACGKELILWDLEARREMRREPIQEAYLFCDLVFSEDDAVLRLGPLYSSAEGSSMLWDVPRLVSEATVPGSE